MKALLKLTLGVTSLLLANIASSSPIFYASEDLTDETSGDDLWRYHYYIANTSGLSLESFSIIFDSALYDFRLVPAAYGDEVNPADYVAPVGWESLASPSDSLLEEDGYLQINREFFDPIDAIASADAIMGFSIDFIWLGAGTPGAQMFDYFEVGAFDPTGNAMTRRYRKPGGGKPVPAPATAWLMLLGLSALMTQRAVKTR